MPGSNPGPDSMGGRPFVTWKSGGDEAMRQPWQQQLKAKLKTRLKLKTTPAKTTKLKTTQLTGNVPEWTKSPWLSVFSDESARKPGAVADDAQDTSVNDVTERVLGLDLADDRVPAVADAPGDTAAEEDTGGEEEYGGYMYSGPRHIIPDYQSAVAKESSAHTEYMYTPPRDAGADCHMLTGQGCVSGARQGASVTGTPLFIEYAPMRLVPKARFSRGTVI